MRFYFGQPIDVSCSRLNDETMRDWVPGIIINPEIDGDGYLTVAYYHWEDGYQWTDRMPLGRVRTSTLPTDLEEHGWSTPEQTRNLLNQVNIFEEQAGDLARDASDERDSVAMAEAKIKDLEQMNHHQALTIDQLMMQREGRESSFLTLMMDRGLELHSRSYMRLLESRAEAADRMLHPVAADLLATVRTLADQDYTMGRLRFDQIKATILEILDTLLSSGVERNNPPRPTIQHDPDKPF
jgi:hypothetical protein